jgi:hypothetical protein
MESLMFRSTRSYLMSMAFVACTGAFVAEPASAQTNGDTRAHDLVSRKCDLIAGFMHPTSAYTSKSFQKKDNYASGSFRLTYRFHFTSVWGNPFWSDMNLSFRSDGTFDYVSPGSTSGLVGPLRAAGAVVDQTRQALLESPDFRRNEELVRIVERGDARSLLEWMLKNAD